MQRACTKAQASQLLDELKSSFSKLAPELQSKVAIDITLRAMIARQRELHSLGAN